MNAVEWVRDLPCVSVTYDAETLEWVFGFGPGVSLRVAAPWRIVGSGRIALGHDDHGQRFGRPRPVDGAATATALLRGRPVKAFSISAISADASVDFGDGLLLQVFNSSSGYEGWTLSDMEGRLVIAQGGGSVVASPKVAR
jgi:hypothetical protein